MWHLPTRPHADGDWAMQQCTLALWEESPPRRPKCGRCARLLGGSKSKSNLPVSPAKAQYKRPIGSITALKGSCGEDDTRQE